MWIPYQNYLKKRKILLNMTINGNNDNISRILNTAKCNKIIYLGHKLKITFESSIIFNFYYSKNR